MRATTHVYGSRSAVARPRLLVPLLLLPLFLLASVAQAAPPSVFFLPARYPEVCALNLGTGTPLQREGVRCSPPPDFCASGLRNLDLAREALGQGSCSAGATDRRELPGVDTLFLVDDGQMSTEVARLTRPAHSSRGVVQPRVIALGTNVMLVGNRYPEVHTGGGGAEAWQQRVRDAAAIHHRFVPLHTGIAEFVLVGQSASDSDSAIRGMARCLANMPDAHEGGIAPIYVVPSLPGEDRGHGAEFYPREGSQEDALRDWLGQAAQTGLPDSVVEEQLAASASGLVAIESAALGAAAPETAVLREMAAALAAAGLDLGGEAAEQEYARWVTEPREGEEAPAQLRSSPAFSAVTASWSPLTSCSTNVALDTGGPAGSGESGGAIAYMYHGQFISNAGSVIESPSEPALREFWGALQELDATTPRAVPATPRTHRQYCADCLAAGVPEPTAFGGPGWRSVGRLAASDLFVVNDRSAEILVYESTSPPGVCVALPRADAGQPIQFLGVICQGEQTGKACFWDNIPISLPLSDSGANSKINKANIREFDLSEFRNGDHLWENCTDCHRGENVYIVHDALSNIPRSDPNNTYEPIPSGVKPYPQVPVGSRNWRNPSNSDSCGGCHDMPRVDKAYCDSVLGPIIARGQMPPRGFTGDSSQTCRDFCNLRRQCLSRGANASSFGTPANCRCR